MIWQILIGIIITFLLTISIRIVIAKNPNPKRLLKTIKSTVDIILWALSPDYKIAKIQKNKLCSSQEKNAENNNNSDRIQNTRADYIKIANANNLIFTLIITFITCTIFMLFKNDWIYNISIGLIGYRLCSRTIEINISFIKDILSKEKKSSLKRIERIKLAFTSLIEEAILFAGIYTVMMKNICVAILGALHSFVLSPVSFCQSNAFGNFLALYQVICTIILLTISFASYISSSD